MNNKVVDVIDIDEKKKIIFDITKKLFEITDNDQQILEDFYEVFINNKILKNANLEKLEEEKIITFLYISVIDNIDNNKSYLLNYIEKAAVKEDIIYNIYKKRWLTPERLEFIVKSENKRFKLSSNLMRSLITKEDTKLLNILFANLKFYDNEIIIEFCFMYKNKTPVSNLELNSKIEKYKIEVSDNEDGILNYFYDACSKNNDIMAKYLIKHGMHVNKEGHRGTPLAMAFYCDNENIVKYLIEHNANVNSRASKNEPRTVLYMACCLGKENIVKILVEHGADANKVIEGDHNWLYLPLLGAIENNNEGIMKILVEHGADINKKVGEKKAPLISACQKEYENIVKYLVEHGANINIDINEYPYSPLISACHHWNENLAIYLIDHGADVNKEVCGEIPLIVTACLERNMKLVEYLVEHGADINKEIDGMTILDRICEDDITYNDEDKEEYENIKRYLVEHGAITNIFKV